MHRQLYGLAVAACALLNPVLVRAELVTSCGQIVEGRGELAADLDCSGYAGVAVMLNGRLDLNGYTLTGNPADSAVRCDPRCRVTGPGTITGAYNAVDGFNIPFSLIKVFDTTITGNKGVGVVGYRVAVLRSTITGNGSVNGSSFALTGGVHGAIRAKVVDSTISGNLNFGVISPRAHILRSSVVGNGTNPDCLGGPFAQSLGCADLTTAHRPAVRSTSGCDRSQKLYLTPGDNWSVCATD